MAHLSSSSMSKPHIALFPFMSKGHTIPLLHLAHLLLHRGVRITIFTTPSNHTFISQFLTQPNNISIIDLPFPNNIPGIPPGIESTDKLPSMSLFVSFINGVKLMQPSFEEKLQNIHSDVDCIISDGFLHWTLQSSSRFGIPRLSFYGMSLHAITTNRDASTNGLISLHESDDEPFTLPSFPWIKLTRNDFNEPLDKRDPRGLHLDFIIEAAMATTNSYGYLANTFYELEQPFADYYNRECQPKAFNVGPLCLAQPPKIEPSTQHQPKWIQWLDRKLTEGSPVLYVAFGSQAKLTPTQLHEIALGLKEAKVSFLWALRDDKFDFENANERGMIVREWVDQREILEHESVKGFLSHCGWNSVLEGICAEVPILAWPMMAEQFLNARMVTEEIKIGLRVNTVDGSVKGFVNGECLKNGVMELMHGEQGKRAAEKVKEVAEMARRAVAEGGSSWRDLNKLIDEIQIMKKEINGSKIDFEVAEAKQREKIGPGLGVLLGGVVGVLIVVIFSIFILSRRKKTLIAPLDKNACKRALSKEPKIFKVSIEEVYAATNNLLESNFIGEGTAGKVYRGVLSNNQHVAIKKITDDGFCDTFLREIRSLLHVRHQNLVHLIGYCESENEHECFLIYQLCPNGNLSQWLYGKDKIISWIQRLEIAIGSAQGLQFLHTFPQGCIVHRDIKPTNILLGTNFEAKLSDFGLSKVMNLDESCASSEVRGTFGYVDPEYQTNHKVSASSDIYSFGVVLLQILSGRKAIDMNMNKPMPLDKIAKGVVKNGGMVEFADPNLNGEYPIEAFRLVFELSLLCTGDKRRRPSIGDVIVKLEEALCISMRMKGTNTPFHTPDYSEIKIERQK